jgi:transcriptional regulator with XRE-family HTH domain
MVRATTEQTIRLLAASRGIWSLRELAQRAGVDRRTVYGAANGTKRPTCESVRRIARALGMPEPELRDLLCGGARG